jgi:hypothetical protein
MTDSNKLIFSFQFLHICNVANILNSKSDKDGSTEVGIPMMLDYVYPLRYGDDKDDGWVAGEAS